jgi:toxin ParE1/3/4
MVRINWTQQASQDLEDIYFHIAKDSKLYAKRQTENIKFRTNILKVYPKIGKPVPEFHFDTIREILDGKYRIVYMIIDELE